MPADRAVNVAAPVNSGRVSVLFSPDGRLAAPPSARQRAQRAFEALDRDLSGFIPTSQLAELMAACDLVTEQE